MIQKDDVVLGDPALLLPYMFPGCRRQTFPSRAICFIPHHNDDAYIKRANFTGRTQFPAELDEANI